MSKTKWVVLKSPQLTISLKFKISSKNVSTDICKSLLVVIEKRNAVMITNRGSTTACGVYIIAVQCSKSCLMNFLTCAM